MDHKVFEKLYKRSLKLEEIREIEPNITGFLELSIEINNKVNIRFTLCNI